MTDTDLRAAAKHVIASWERGDLAAAVGALSAALEDKPAPMTPDEILEAAKALPKDQLWPLAWKLMDEAGIVSVIALSVDDIRETLNNSEIEDTYTDEQVMDAMRGVSEGDWSNHASVAMDSAIKLLTGEWP